MNKQDLIIEQKSQNMKNKTKKGRKLGDKSN